MAKASVMKPASKNVNPSDVIGEYARAEHAGAAVTYRRA